MIARMLAGVAPAGRPVFLKIVYHGPKAMEELVRYDPHLVVGILGGSAGTTRDAFQMLADAQKYGAKVALYGRKINNAENQLAFIQFLRLIVDGVIGPVEAVKAYHAVLGKLGIAPKRPLEDDLKLQSGRHELRRDVDLRHRPRPARAGQGRGLRLPLRPPARPEPAAADACHCHEPAGDGQRIGEPADRIGKPSTNGSPARSTAGPTSPGWTSPSAWRTIGTGSASVADPDSDGRVVALARLELRGVEKTYPGGIAAVRGVDLTVEDGELFVIVGPSGSGKSTLLRLVAGLESPDSGSLSLDGRPIDGLAPRDRDVAMVFQDQVLYPHLDVFENIAFGLRARRVAAGRGRGAGPGDGVGPGPGRLPPDGARRRSRAASGGGSRWGGRWSSGPGSSCSTSRSRGSTPRSGPRPGPSWSTSTASSGRR